MLHNIEIESSEVNHKKYVGKASKKMENSTLRGEGGQQGSFSTFNIFFVPNGLKINFRH